MTDGHVGPEQAVLDCLDRALSSRGYHARVEPAALIAAGELVSQFERRANKEIALQIRRLPSVDRRPTYAFFCEDPGYGALALRDRYDYIVLKIGIVPRLIDFCLRMMNTEGLWPKISKHERARMAFAIVFAAECFDIIVRHELAHLVLGHCDFMAGRGNPASMEDSDGVLPAGIDALTAQALEMAADGHSAIWGVQKLPHIRKRVGRLPSDIDQAYGYFHSTPDESMLNYLLAIFFVFRLCDETAWSNERLASRCHPPAPIRFQAASIHLIEYFKSRGDVEAEKQLSRAMQEIWPLGEILFARTVNRNPDPRPMHQTMSEESERHYNLLSDRAGVLPERLFGLQRTAG